MWVNIGIRKFSSSLNIGVFGSPACASQVPSPQAQAVAFNPVGQTVGMMNGVQSVREVVTDLVEGYVDAVERLNGLAPE